MRGGGGRHPLPRPFHAGPRAGQCLRLRRHGRARGRLPAPGASAARGWELSLEAQRLQSRENRLPPAADGVASVRTDCELGRQVPKGEVCRRRQKLVSVFPLVLPSKRSEKGTALGSAGRWAGWAQRPQESPGPQVSLQPLSPCLWPCLRGLRGGRGGWCSTPGIWPRACVCCTWLLGVWLCGRGQGLEGAAGPSTPVQGNPGARSGRRCCVGSRPFLAKHLFVWFWPLISLKRMGRAAHYLAPRPFTVRTDPGATALNARFWFHLTPKHVAITSVARGSKRGFLKTGSLPRALLAALGDAAPQPVTREASPLRSVSDNHGATCVCAGSGWFEQRPC